MTSIWYEVSGVDDAPVVVLGGSLGTTSEMWRPQLDAIEGTFRVLRFDHLGHGRSAVPDGPYRIEHLADQVIAALDEAGIGSFCYCGLSLGGMVGMAVAARWPERVERLALLCTSAYFPPASGWLERAALVRSAGTAAVIEQTTSRWFTSEFQAQQPQMVETLIADLRTIPPEGYAGCCEAIATMDLRPDLASITAPTLVIHGADDPAIPLPHSQEIAETIPGARLAVVEHAAHLATVEQPDSVTGLLVGHLTGSIDATV